MHGQYTGKNMNVRFYIKNFGCRLNQHEGDIIGERLLDSGWVRADWRESDVVIVNGCTVTARADQKVRQFVHRVRRENPAAKILITGCTASALLKHLIRFDEEVIVVPPRFRYAIPQFLKSGGGYSDGDIPADEIRTDGQFVLTEGKGISRTRANLKIQDGCDRRCAYCIVPIVRGGAVSRPAEDVIEQAKRFESAGFKEIVLTGVDIGTWRDGDLTLASLLRLLLERTEVYRFRLSSIEPPGLTEDLLELLAAEPRLAPHLHIPIQSGSQRLLRDMNRPFYRIADLVEKFERLRSARADFCFGTDIIVGFPTETEQDFEDTRRLLSAGVFAYAHIFRYSPRPGTAAYSLKPLPAGEVSRRAKILGEIDAHNRVEFARKFVGRQLEFLVERRAGEYVLGRAANFLRVKARGVARRNQIATVQIHSAEPMTVIGEVVEL